MPSEFKITRQVEFADTDMIGIMHFSNFFRYMEACETAFLRSLGLALGDPTAKQNLGWPRVHASCEYQAPLRLGDTVEIHLFVKQAKGRVISYVFRFRKLLPGGKFEDVAEGELTVVCVSIDLVPQKIVSRDLPPDVLAKLQPAQIPP